MMVLLIRVMRVLCWHGIRVRQGGAVRDGLFLVYKLEHVLKFETECAVRRLMHKLCNVQSGGAFT